MEFPMLQPFSNIGQKSHPMYWDARKGKEGKGKENPLGWAPLCLYWIRNDLDNREKSTTSRKEVIKSEKTRFALP